MEKENLFKWKHYQPELILLTVRWYLRYNLSFRNLVEMMEERGLSIAHTTIMRWVHQYGPQLEGMQLRQVRYLNNIVEQDHRFIKKRVRSMLGFKSFKTATSILSGVEAMHMMKKGQLHQQVKSIQNEVEFVHNLFGITS
ncbi:DDE-type integrase/transposase/recombinase [Bacillus thuringiensis]|uniref:DDE-type integrase/transposase/recombinase n=1 Tax=Bacillus thuringiensis TaxID=1428 RepID=UPI002225A009|nr:DDE-type integrase/transposase/recombinase [Bacillus thuringiensis]UYX52241.1 DDE-type integrase/transposase/recombinase [Bacillus thuringiensis]